MLARSIPLARSIQGQVLLATAFACLTYLGALVSIPIGPVPITLQLLFVVLSGLVLGSKLGAASQLEYLAIGFAGAPVFSLGRSGLAALLGPTGGYLPGFVLAAFVAGLIAESASRPGKLRFFLAGLAGTAVDYLLGTVWLATWFSVGKGTNWIAELGNAWTWGMLPFIALDTAKALVASGVTISGRRLFGIGR